MFQPLTVLESPKQPVTSLIMFALPTELRVLIKGPDSLETKRLPCKMIYNSTSRLFQVKN